MNFKNWITGDHLPLRLTALITWLLVSYTIVFNAPEIFTIGEAYDGEKLTLGGQLHMAFWLVLYYVGTVMGTSGTFSGRSKWTHRIGAAIMALCLFPIVLFGPKQDEQLILMVIFAGVLAYVASMRWTFIIVLVLHMIIVGIFRYRWYNDFYWPGSLLYFGFSLFAMVSNNIARRESTAREELAVANKQLLAAQQLLTDSAIQDERLRISRDLHDALGHHLTALNLQLEVAKKLATDKVLTPIEQAHGICKQLLADVRQVVADIRAVPGLKLNKSLQQLISSAKGRAQLDIDPELRVNDSQVVETIFRLVQEIVTNSNRHSKTGKLFIKIDQSPTHWALRASDGGASSTTVEPGVGIKGMRERVEALGGDFEMMAENGLTYTISIPRHD